MFGLSSEDQQFSRVADFYNSKSVFITGAAGFVGTILLETLLRCCPEIESIYILLRSKKNVKPEFRKEQIFNKKIFEKLKGETPELLDKVHVISGDISLPNLGMNDGDKQLLLEEVSVVFHCAAVLNFTKPLEFILISNVVSLNIVIELCKKMRKLEALVYTSTAYCNCNHASFPLKEEVYRLPFRAEKFLDALRNEDSEKLQELFTHCKPDWPNTYTFSKCLAENLIMDTASDLPVAIIRPSAVFSTWKHPMPGYLEENSGIMALTLGIGKGFIRVLYADPNSKLNLVPVDIVANTHVVAAWSVGTKRCVSPLVVNCTGTEKFHVKITKYNETMKQLFLKYPLPLSFEQNTSVIILSNKVLYYIVAAYQHYLVAIVLDGMKRILGKKPRLYSLYRFCDAITESLKFFLFQTFEFERENLEYLDKLIQPDDKKDFSLDFREGSFLEMSLTLPEVSPFYNWKRDRNSRSERQKIIYRRHILINCIQGIFLMICGLFIYKVLTLIFL